MPLIAQSFVESRSRSNRDSVTFDMVASASALGGEQTSRFSSSTVATQTPSPRHNLKLNTPRSSSSRKSDRSHSSPSGSSEIFSLSDSQLADKYQVSFLFIRSPNCDKQTRFLLISLLFPCHLVP